MSHAPPEEEAEWDCPLDERLDDFVDDELLSPELSDGREEDVRDLSL